MRSRTRSRSRTRTRTNTVTTGLSAALVALLVLAGCTAAPPRNQPGAAASAAPTPAPAQSSESGGGNGAATAGFEGPLPQDQNLLAWTGDPNDAGHVTAQSAAGVGGRITLVRIVLRERITWSNIWLGLAGIDPNAQLANCRLGVYSEGGTLLGTTPDVSPQLMTDAIAKPLALEKPFTAEPGTYFIALLLNGTWATNALTLKSTGAGISVNAGLTPPKLRYSTILTGQTSLPPQVNLAEQSNSTINTGWASQWYAVS
ncbi:hypothetical protein [Streptomyces antarcticus]|uniref:hypothetical protein n=1 Tax=Streptomyces antarcticus TaxID=2996458 RepID=UPI002270AAAE|nr:MULTISPECIES: hypothetical protein [unclassified Streptomyces]MCY0945506.1 hypothetical protein [Streptomyces sp. H34-AA3]MCZ4083628.1 hypothetical protein [Streptomyces sp. H34-S5]